MRLSSAIRWLLLVPSAVAAWYFAVIVSVVLREIVASLERGDPVKLSSFGSFGIRDKGQRIGRNPKTGQEVPITPRRVLVFRASNIMKQRINESLSRRKAAE